MAVGAAAVDLVARDVHVRPGQPAGELPQERRGVQATAPAHPVVLEQVGDLGRGDPLLHLLGDRHRPQLLARDRAGVEHRPDRRVRAEDGTDPVAEGDLEVAGQGGHVDDDVGLLLAGQLERVAEQHPALGVGVGDLDGLAAVHRDDVAGTHRGAGDHVLGHRGVGGDLDREAEAGDGEGRCDHGGRAGHVALHADHAAGRLDGEAARVEGDALADEGQVALGALGRPGQRGPAAAWRRSCCRRRACRRSRARRAACRRGPRG